MSNYLEFYNPSHPIQAENFTVTFNDNNDVLTVTCHVYHTIDEKKWYGYIEVPCLHRIIYKSKEQLQLMNLHIIITPQHSSHHIIYVMLNPLGTTLANKTISAHQIIETLARSIYSC